MKNTTTNGKTSTVKPVSGVRLTSQELQWFETVKANLDKAKEDLKCIAKVRHYDDPRHMHGCGIGFLNLRKPDEKIVEFEYNDQGVTFEEITLSKSAEWMAKMQFAEIRTHDCADREDEAEIRWLELVQVATA